MTRLRVVLFAVLMAIMALGLYIFSSAPGAVVEFHCGLVRRGLRPVRGQNPESNY